MRKNSLLVIQFRHTRHLLRKNLRGMRRGVSLPAAEGVSHGGMGGARIEIYLDKSD
jgi:hypothetical protein